MRSNLFVYGFLHLAQQWFCKIYLLDGKYHEAISFSLLLQVVEVEAEGEEEEEEDLRVHFLQVLMQLMFEVISNRQNGLDTPVPVWCHTLIITQCQHFDWSYSLTPGGLQLSLCLSECSKAVHYIRNQMGSNRLKSSSKHNLVLMLWFVLHRRRREWEWWVLAASYFLFPVVSGCSRWILVDPLTCSSAEGWKSSRGRGGFRGRGGGGE